MHIFTDGSCVGTKDERKAGWGVVIYNDDKECIKELSGMIEPATNQRAELMALKVGIGESNDGSVIYSDSIYGIKCITEWSMNWKENGWKTTSKQDVKNRDIIEPMLDMYENKRITFRHVKGHQKGTSFEVVGNNAADKMATSVYC